MSSTIFKVVCVELNMMIFDESGERIKYIEEHLK